MASGDGWAVGLVPFPRVGTWTLDDVDDWPEIDVPDPDVLEVLRERRAVQAAAEATPAEALWRLGLARSDRDQAQAEIDMLVPVALAKGASWSDLVAVLGVTRQALQKRYPQQGDRAN